MKSLMLSAVLMFALNTYSLARDFHWNGALAPGKTLEIKNIHGDIVAARSPSTAVEVTGVKHARWSDPSSVRIEVEQRDSGVIVRAIYPSAGWGYIGSFLLRFFGYQPEPSNQAACSPGFFSNGSGSNDVRVDFTVKVPDGVYFAPRSVNGNVDALMLSANIDARTVNGSIRISSKGDANAATVNGSIEATIGSLNRPSEFTTVNGAITVALPSDAHATLDATTVNGKISSDFPVTVQGSFVGRTMKGQIAGGGPELKLTSVNGSITLRKSQ